MRALLLIVAMPLLGGCALINSWINDQAVEYPAGDLGICYRDLNNAFCVVKTPPGTTVVSGTAPASVANGAVANAAAIAAAAVAVH